MQRRILALAGLVAAAIGCSGGPSDNDLSYVTDPNSKGNSGVNNALTGQGACSATRLNTGSEPAGDPAIAMDPQALPIVSWTDTTQGVNNIFVRRFDGQDWSSLGASDRGTGVSLGGGDYSSLAVDSLGRVILAWVVGHAVSTSTTSYGVLVRRYAGSSWNSVDGSGAYPGLIDATVVQPSNITVTLDSNNAPYVVWQAGSGPTDAQIYAMGDDAGLTWGNLIGNNPVIADGATTNVAAPSSYLWRTSDNTNEALYVAYATSKGSISVGSIHSPTAGTAAPGTNNVFTLVTASGALGTQAQNPVIWVDSNGTPWVAYEDSVTSNYEIYVASLQGGAWVGPAGTAGGDNVSNNLGASHRPSLVLDSYNRPRVSWDDETLGHTVVYFKYWDGKAWSQAVGSATGAGISHAKNNTLHSKLAVGNNDGLALTWQADDGIYACAFAVPTGTATGNTSTTP